MEKEQNAKEKTVKELITTSESEKQHIRRPKPT